VVTDLDRLAHQAVCDGQAREIIAAVREHPLEAAGGET
jgi:hypothetical protein